MSNVRFDRGQVSFRDGFKSKYTGLREPALWVDVAYASSADFLLAFTKNDIYFVGSGSEMSPIEIYDPDSGSAPLTKPLQISPGSSNISIDVGYGKYKFQHANAGALFPSSTGDGEALADLLVYTDTAESGVYVIAYTGVEGSPGVQAERITSDVAPVGGQSVAVFAGRLFVCGTTNNKSEVRWSAVARFDRWDSELYPDAGSIFLADSPDWIVSAKKLGDYLIVYKERSIYIGRETYIPDPAIRFEPAPGQGIGLAAPNSIGDLGEEHIFLGWDDVYVFSLNRIQAVGSRIKDELFRGEDGILPSRIGSCTGVIAEEFSEYWLFVPTGKMPTTTDNEDVVNRVTDPSLVNGLSNWSALEVAYWKLDSDLTDSSINSNSGSAIGTINYVTGVDGQAAAFDGSTGANFGPVNSLFAGENSQWSILFHFSKSSTGTVFDNGNIVVELKENSFGNTRLHITVRGAESIVLENVSGFTSFGLIWDGGSLEGVLNAGTIVEVDSIQDENGEDILDSDSNKIEPDGSLYWEVA